MRLAGDLKIDGDKVVLQQGGNATTITSNSPASDITLTLPATTDSLVGRATTDTLTNKTLTSPKINEDVVLTATATELNQLDGVTVGGTSAGDIVSIDGAQTLTNKTIVAASNTITTAASGNLASTELNAALAELQGSIDVRVLTSVFDLHVVDFDDHTGALTAHGVSGVIVGTSSTQTLLNKTLTNPKINDTIALTATSTELNYVKNVTSAIQTQLDGKEPALTGGTSAQYFKGDKTLGTFATDVAATAAVTANTTKVSADGSIGTHSDVDVATDAPVTGDVLTYDGTNWVPGTGGSGSGSKNYVENPSASGDTSSWSTTGTMTIERVDADHADAANRPRANTTGTCFKASGGVADDYAYADFTLDDADLRAANLLVKLAAIVADASTWKVQLVAYSDSARTADETEITLVDADSAGDWFLAATTAEFTTWWTPNPSLPYMQLRIVDTVGSKTIYWSDTLVGPGDAVSGAVITPWTDVPIADLLAGDSGNYTVSKCAWRQVGENAEYYVVAVGDASGTGNVQFQLHDTTLTPALSDGDNLELGSMIDETNSTGINSRLTGNWDATNKKFTVVRVEASRSATLTYPSFTSVRTINFRFSVPITDWARSGTVGLGTNRVEYAWNSGTWDASNTTEFGYGPSGATIDGVLAGAVNKTVRFQTPIQPTDDIEIQLSPDGTSWFPAIGARMGATSNDVVFPSKDAAGVFISGVSWYISSSTDIVVSFRQYMSAANDGSPGTDWGSGYWRVRKTSAGVVTGYGQATADAHGLQAPTTAQVDLDITGSTDYSSEYRAVGVAYSDAFGNWRLKFNVGVVFGTTGTAQTLSIAGVTFKNITNFRQAVSVTVFGQAATQASFGYANPGASTVTLNSERTETRYVISGDVELDSKPTWA